MAAVFKHMKPDEIRIWKKYLTRENLDEKDFLYDIRVGEGEPIPPGSTPADKRMIEALTQHRIDALKVAGAGTIIYEVKKDFGLSAIGQVLGYEDLLLQDIAAGKQTFPANILKVIIYETKEADVDEVANRLKIVTTKV